MPGAGDVAPAVRGVDDGVEEGGQHRLGEVFQCGFQLVQQVLGCEVEPRQCADAGGESSHDGCGRGAVSHDVADGERDLSAVESDYVIPVAADFVDVDGGQVAVGDLHPRELGDVLGKQASLEHEGGVVFTAVETGVVHADGGAGREFAGEAHVVVRERADGPAPVQGAETEHDAAGDQRHHHERVHALLEKLCGRR